VSRKAFVVLGLVAALSPGCALIPRDNLRLDEARRAFDEAAADPSVARLAAAELEAARELLERASHARDTLDDAAEVDHLAYLAKREVVIAREAAIQRMAQRAPGIRNSEER
jgi:hypothetical protein